MRLGVERQAPAPGRRFRRHHKLRRSADYLRCYRRGRKRHGSLATLHFHPNEERTARLGITASRKVGKAAVRNRAKRRIREIFRLWEGRASLSTLDIVVHLRPEAGRAERSALKEELEHLLSHVAAAGSPEHRRR